MLNYGDVIGFQPLDHLSWWTELSRMVAVLLVPAVRNDFDVLNIHLEITGDAELAIGLALSSAIYSQIPLYYLLL